MLHAVWAWAAVALLISPLDGSAHAATGGDYTPPELLSLTVTPASAPNTQFTEFEFELSASDNLAGVNYIHIQFESPSGTRVHPRSALFLQFSVGPDDLVEGTAQDGVWRRTLSWGQWEEPGEWTLSMVTLYDLAFNERTYHAAELQDRDRFGTLELTGLIDSNPPVVTSISLSPAEISNQGISYITYQIGVTDDVSGVARLRVRIGRLGGIPPSTGSTSTLISGTPQNGVLEGFIDFPAWSDLGEYAVLSVSVDDEVDRTGRYSRDTLIAMGVPMNTVTMTGIDDDTPPRVERVLFEPSAIRNGSTSGVAIHVDFSDAQSGLDQLRVYLRGPAGEEKSTAYIQPYLHLISGDENTGTVRDWVSFGATTSPGVWAIDRIFVEDVHGNVATYTAMDLHDEGAGLGTLGVGLPDGTPTPVADLTTTSASGGEVLVQWAPPGDEGDSAVTEYRVEARVASATAGSTGLNPFDPTTPQPEIVGGSTADVDDFRWQGALLVSGEADAGRGQFCGISMIAPRWGVTAAHCVDTKSPHELHVAFGVTLLSRVNVNHRVPVVSVVVHPGWDKDKATSDIALLHLAAAPPLGIPIGVSTDPTWPPTGALGWASGWGNLLSSHPDYAAYYPDDLQAARLYVQAGPTAESCEYWGVAYDSAHHLCAGYDYAYRGTCSGDSGGPYAIPGADLRWELVGVTSFGPAPQSGDCGFPYLPSIFARVTSYADWIFGHVPLARWEQMAATQDLSATISGLDPGFDYEVRVVAVNEQGESPEARATIRPQGERQTYPWPDRIAGSNRYATAAAISLASFPDPSAIDTVFVATGTGFADALAGAPIAGILKAPLLLVNPSFVPAATDAELARLDPETIVILGGSAAVSPQVETALSTRATTVRLAGGTRFETAVAISQYAFPTDDSVDDLIVASGAQFADALAGAPAAAHLVAPILLTRPDGLPEIVADEIVRLGPQRIILIGGPAAVSDAVLTRLETLAPEVIRISGPNRYSTAIQINALAFDAAPKAFIATGLNYPDALAGAAAAGALDLPLYLVPEFDLPGDLLGAFSSLGVDEVVILGGVLVVSNSIWLQLDAV